MIKCKLNDCFLLKTNNSSGKVVHCYNAMQHTITTNFVLWFSGFNLASTGGWGILHLAAPAMLSSNHNKHNRTQPISSNKPATDLQMWSQANYKDHWRNSCNGKQAFSSSYNFICCCSNIHTSIHHYIIRTVHQM